MPAENIFAQFTQPVRSVSDYLDDYDKRDIRRLQLEGQTRQNALAALTNQQQMNDMADKQRSQNIIRQVYAGADPSAGPQALLQALERTGDRGAIDLASAKRTELLKQREVESKAGSQDVETENRVISTYRDLVGNASNPEQAAQYVQIMHSDPRLKNTAIARVPLDQALAQIGSDPATFNTWKQQFALGAQKFVEMNKPTYQQQNLGGTMQTLALPGLGGTPTVAATAPITQSADNRATQETQRRGQNMTDARARETNQLTREANATVYDPERGILVNKATGLARPAATMDGKPVAAKTPESTKKELASIDAQLSVLDGAIRDVKASPDAFTFKRGLATMTGPLAESAVGRLDSPSERDARSYVFNVVSKVINERAGAAQSAQELARLRSFLPAETDNAQQITDKLESFKGYLSDLGNGYQPGKYQPQQSKAAAGAPSKIANDADYNALPSGATFIGPDGKTRRKP